MPLTEGSVVEILDEQTYDNSQVINSYHYEVESITGTPATPAEVGEAFWTLIGGNVRGLQNAALLHEQIRVEEVAGDRMYGQYIIPPGEQAGTRGGGGDATASFIAYGITLQGETRQTKPGGKRIAGALETDVGAFGVLVTEAFDDLVDFAELLQQPLDVGESPNVTTLRPVIYRPPATPDPAVVNPIVGFIAKTDITTQNTRKRGRGA